MYHVVSFFLAGHVVWIIYKLFCSVTDFISDQVWLLGQKVQQDYIDNGCSWVLLKLFGLRVEISEDIASTIHQSPNRHCVVNTSNCTTQSMGIRPPQARALRPTLHVSTRQVGCVPALLRFKGRQRVTFTRESCHECDFEFGLWTWKEANSFSKDFSILKDPSSNISFHWNVANETSELWTLSVETGFRVFLSLLDFTSFENVTPSGIFCSFILSLRVQVLLELTVGFPFVRPNLNEVFVHSN